MVTVYLPQYSYKSLSNIDVHMHGVCTSVHGLRYNVSNEQSVCL